jgi:hypothetical protein
MAKVRITNVMWPKSSITTSTVSDSDSNTESEKVESVSALDDRWDAHECQ